MREKFENKKAQSLMDDLTAKGIVMGCIHGIVENINHCQEMLDSKGLKCPTILSQVKKYVEKEKELLDKDGQKTWDSLRDHRGKCEHDFEVVVDVPEINEQMFICKKCGQTKVEKKSE